MLPSFLGTPERLALAFAAFLLLLGTALLPVARRWHTRRLIQVQDRVRALKIEYDQCSAAIEECESHLAKLLAEESLLNKLGRGMRKAAGAVLAVGGAAAQLYGMQGGFSGSVANFAGDKVGGLVQEGGKHLLRSEYPDDISACKGQLAELLSHQKIVLNRIVKYQNKQQGLEGHDGSALLMMFIVVLGLLSIFMFKIVSPYVEDIIWP